MQHAPRPGARLQHERDTCALAEVAAVRLQEGPQVAAAGKLQQEEGVSNCQMQVVVEGNCKRCM